MKKTILITLLALVGMSQAVAHEADYLPIAREGVTWVNEKVIVNHGDTTRYYYKYQICGYDTAGTNNLLNEKYRACYYYIGEALDVENDSLIAGLYSFGKNTWCGRNHAYWNANAAFRMNQLVSIDVEAILLYPFGTESYTPDEYYIYCQEMSCPPDQHFLTVENFYEVNPVLVEGVSCRRWAYVDEIGDTLCLVVDGIGFDSRDMGDLLTPFTRRPDPDADYQEWCGLSHVVKDGQIIYKGMRYREGNLTDIDEAVADRTVRSADPHYYDLMGRAVGTDIPTVPGIYIHQGKKIVVR